MLMRIFKYELFTHSYIKQSKSASVSAMVSVIASCAYSGFQAILRS